jgi:hypothetical protein
MTGFLGQYVISNPIIDRLGHHRGGRSGKPFTDEFYVYIDEVYKIIEMGS